MGWTFRVRIPLEIIDFIFSIISRPALMFIQVHIQWISRFLPGVKWSERAADHSFPYSAEVKNNQSYKFTPWAG